ncbi:MAG: hypothetical protein PHT49_03325 [Desulfovibrionales bacterium]|nr:hypothetical protein [Desulfovibrionales bacterium]
MNVKNIKTILIVFVFLFPACAPQLTVQHTFLTARGVLVPREEFAPIPKFDSTSTFRSAKSVKENSVVELGVWRKVYIEREKVIRQIFLADIKITNTSTTPYITPEELIIFDADKNALRLLRPDEYVYYIEGMTSEDALGQSTALSAYAARTQANQFYNTYTAQSYYGSTYGSDFGAFFSGFDSGMSTAASIHALSLARQAAEINEIIRTFRLCALRPILTLPDSSNVGRVWSLTGNLPIEIHIFAGGDHHIIKLNHNKPGLGGTLPGFRGILEDEEEVICNGRCQ